MKTPRIKTPRCEVCNKAEFKNKIYYAYVFDNQIKFYGERAIMCKDCEAKQKVIATTQYGNEPIYKKPFLT